MNADFTPPSLTQAERDARDAAELARLNREHNVVTDIAQLNGWTIVELIRHRPGVVKYIAQRHAVATSGMLQIIGYAKDEVFTRLQLPK